MSKKKKIIISVFAFVLVFLFFSASFYFLGIAPDLFESDKDKPREEKIETDLEYEFRELEIDVDFAEYNIERSEFEPSIPSYDLHHTELKNFENFQEAREANFTPNQTEALNTQHFFITENLDEFYDGDPEKDSGRINDWTDLYGNRRINDWTDLYGNIRGGGRYYRRPENSVFITTDFLLHVYHKLLEKEFEYIEQNEFYPRIQEITDEMFSSSVEMYEKVEDTQNKESYERIIAYFAVPKAILDVSMEEFESDEFGDQKLDTEENVLSELEDLKDRIPEESYNLAKEELALVLDQSELEDSPIFSSVPNPEDDLEFKEDYSQYTPRARYTKNSVLRSYFKSMIWYGRNNFFLESSELTRDAIHVVSLLNETNQVENWEDVYVSTSFLVGQSDDLGIYEYGKVLSSLDFKSVDSKLVSQVQEKLEDFEGPEIMSSPAVGDEIFDLTPEELQEKTKGFRFMGQRFTPDAYIFTTLTQGDELPDEETGESLPSSGTALSVMSALGNDTARELVDEWVEEEEPDSEEVFTRELNKLEEEFEEKSFDTWTQNIYWGWLYMLRSLSMESEDKSGYPEFMKNEMWHKKSLQSSLGSWTELQHDTLLYSKQSYAELGAGGGDPELPPVPKGYVEPNIEFFDRLLALSNMKFEGLKERGLLEDIFVGRNEKFIDSVEFFRDIAIKQLENEIIEEEDFERLRTESSSLSNVIRPLPDEQGTEDLARSALIADVHTDVTQGEILYQANGIPNYIYVAVKDANGTRLTKGVVYSYFEFTGPLGERINNQEWREINYREDKSEIPDPPDWTQSLIE